MANLTVINSFPIWLPQTQTWMHSQIAELQRIGVDAHIVCELRQNNSQFCLNNIHCFADELPLKRNYAKFLRKLKIRANLNYLVEIGRQIDVDIVHSHFGDVGWANLDEVRYLSAKHVVTFYGMDVNRLPTQNPIWRDRYRRLFLEADLFLCEGEHMKQCLIDLGCANDKVRVQHLGVDLTRFKYKARCLHKDEPLRVLIAASFREKKGIPYAIEALGIVNSNTPVEVTIIGDASGDAESEAEKAKLYFMLDKTKLRNKTRLLGYQPHSIMISEAYSHHLFLQPSITASNGDTEGGAPVSIIEMLATGMPVVSTIHCDIPDVFDENLRHLLAPERNVSEIARIIEDLISHPDKWAEIGAKGSAWVSLYFDLKVQGKKLYDIYSALMRESNERSN